MPDLQEDIPDLQDLAYLNDSDKAWLQNEFLSLYLDCDDSSNVAVEFTDNGIDLTD